MNVSGGSERKKLDLKNKAIAKYKFKNNRFEIIVNPDLAFKLKMKHISEDEVPILEILEIDAVFSDAGKGQRASADELIEAFETDDELAVARIILKKGELQLTQAQRKELADNKRKQIINFISKHAVDPKLNIPHPPARIENALEVANIKIDPYDNIDSQIKRVVKELQTVLPMKLEQVKLAIKMPAEYAGKGYGVVKRFGDIKQEQYTNDGYWICSLEFPAGRQPEFMEKIEELSKGRAEIKIIERSQFTF
jgi:ribosome maturation protein SDO1